MTNKKLEAIFTAASDNLLHYAAESEDELEKSMAAAFTEAQAQEAPRKFRIAFTILIDLDKSKLETALSFGVRRTLSSAQPLPDPEQMQLPGVVTISNKPITDMDGDTLPPAIAKAVKTVDEAIVKRGKK